MKLLKIYNSIRLKRMMKRIKPFVDLNSNSHYEESFEIQLRNPQKGNIYLTTGENCVLDGCYIFERETGKITIGSRVHIGRSTLISVDGIQIDDDVTIAWDCLIYDHNSHSVYWEERKNDTRQEYSDISKGLNPIQNKDWSVVKSAPIHICSKAWIGTGVKILKGVTVGEGAVIAAGSVVVKDTSMAANGSNNKKIEIR